jgi:hypothetical protein
VHRRRWTGQIENFIHLDLQRHSYIMPHQLKVRVAGQVLDVFMPSCEKIIDAQHAATGGQQPLAEMGAYKTGAAGDQGCLLSCSKHLDHHHYDQLPHYLNAINGDHHHSFGSKVQRKLCDRTLVSRFQAKSGSTATSCISARMSSTFLVQEVSKPNCLK